MKIKKYLLLFLISLIILLVHQPILNLLVFVTLILVVIILLPTNPLAGKSFKEELYRQKLHHKYKGP